MIYLWQILEIAALFIFLFAIIHSVLAANFVKEKIKKHAPEALAFYRLFYNLISLLTLYVWYKLSPKPSITIYDLKYPFDVIFSLIQLLGFAGVLWTMNYLCFKEFIGIAQIKRFLEGRFNPDENDDNTTITFSGPYSFSRHPLYLFSIVILLFSPQVDLFYLTATIIFIAYFYIG
ncbi:MAG: hypothetical protein D6830_02440, partial [Ignavibacteria bacterium]